MPLLRRGHAALALAVWLVHETVHGATAGGIVAAVLFSATWYGALRWTLLRESRAAPSSAFTIVRTIEAAAFLALVVLAVRGLLLNDAPTSGDLYVVGEVAVLAMLWQTVIGSNAEFGDPHRVLVIGPAEVVSKIEREQLAPGARPFELVGWIDDRVDEEPTGTPVRTTRLGSLDDLERIAYGGGFDLVVVGVRSGRPSLYSRMLELTHLDLGVIEYPAFFERSFGRVPLSEITPTWFLHTMHVNRRDERQTGKRIVDLVLGSIGVVLGAPVFALAALAIKLDSPGPVLFRQVRIGEHGRRFTMLKLRSMRTDFANDERTWTGTGDPRITRVGAILRRFRIDELPQLVNVLRGEMTLVGPRPETVDYVRWLAEEIPFYKPRHFSKPGITGWAQVCAGYASSLDDTRTKLSYDLYYIRNRSLAFDLAILLRTVATVVGGSGAR
jgi:exopolysaccharide biosynthesis polyprenyl glycosylphosphotransferase